MLKEFWKIQNRALELNLNPIWIKVQLIWILKSAKLYKWLVYYIMNPYKKFLHFIKCLAIFNSMAKHITEKK